MMVEKIIRTLVALALCIFMLYVCFWAFLVAAFVGRTFYWVPIAAITLLIIVWVIVGLFSLPKSRLLKISSLVVPAVCALAAVAYEMHERRINNIPVLNEQTLYVADYQPFKEGTKAAMLDEPSTLALTDSLPRLDGATAMYPLYAAFAQAVYPRTEEYYPYDAHNIVWCNAAAYSYENLLNDSADIIFRAGLSSEQLSTAARQGKVLEMTPIGREAFVFVVNINNPVSELTIRQIQDIYSGRITNWKQVGGKNEKIIAYQRPGANGSQTMMKSVMAGHALMSPPIDEVIGGVTLTATRAADYKNFDNAIGYTFRFYTAEMVRNNQVKLIKVNGVYPHKNTIRNETYPFISNLYAITTGERSKNEQAFINWILSGQGQHLVAETGYVSIKRKNQSFNIN